MLLLWKLLLQSAKVNVKAELCSKGTIHHYLLLSEVDAVMDTRLRSVQCGQSEELHGLRCVLHTNFLTQLHARYGFRHSDHGLQLPYSDRHCRHVTTLLVVHLQQHNMH